MNKNSVFSSLKTKVLMGLLLVASLAISACVYGLWKFNYLEHRLRAANETYIPALRSLNQIEGSFFLLESDLDRSLDDGLIRSRESDLHVIMSKIEQISKLKILESSVFFRTDIDALVLAFKGMNETIDKLYSNWENRSSITMDVSSSKNLFHLYLKNFIRDVEREVQLTTDAVQKDISRSALIVTILLAFCLLSAIFMAYWLSKSLDPLKVLSNKMRSISENGLSLADIGDSLLTSKVGKSEITILAQEFNKMASSILDQTTQLGAQKKNLENAHLEMAKQNIALRKTQAKLLHSEKLALVGKLAAQMAHEVRNPLHALSLHIEVLEEHLRRSGFVAESLMPVKREVERLIVVSNSYLDLSRGPVLKVQPQNINDILKEIHEFYLPLLNEKNINFIPNLEKIPECSIDKTQFTQVIGNLIKNSMESFGPEEKSKLIRISSSYKPERNLISINVHDNGIGIDIDSQPDIFSPFYTSKASGSGLGLAYSKHVIELHGGIMSFESLKDNGTTFTLNLPVV